jgi:hypothetical protein
VANEQNLKPFPKGISSEVAAINGQKGGLAKAKAQREKKTIQAILTDYLNNDVKSNQNLKRIADAAGIKGNQSIKELVAAVCIINTLKKGDVDKLAKLSEILGESGVVERLEDISEAEADVFGND